MSPEMKRFPSNYEINISSDEMFISLKDSKCPIMRYLSLAETKPVSSRVLFHRNRPTRHLHPDRLYFDESNTIKHYSNYFEIFVD